MKRVVSMVLAVVVFTSTVAAQSQVSPQKTAAAWRGVAQTFGVGSVVTLSLDNGQRIRATLIEIGDTYILMQPKTRVPVAVQSIPYEAIVSLERESPKKGASPLKTAAIGAGSGAAGFFLGVLLLLAAAD
jgi:hypothetical protein